MSLLRRAVVAGAIALIGCGEDTPPPIEASLDVMTVNIRHDEDEWERRFELIADEIVRLDPDIVGMQEIEIGIDQTASLLALIADRGGPDYEFYEHLKWTPYDVLTGEGVGVLSRYPIVESDTANLLEGGRVAVWARVEIEPGYHVDMYDTHFEGQGNESAGLTKEEIQIQQAELSVDFIETTSDAPIQFFTGDLNTTDDTPQYDVLIEGGLVDSFPAVHGEDTATIGNTSPIVLMEGAVQDPVQRIDFVFGRTDPDSDDAVATPTDSIVCFQNADDAGFYPTDHLGVMTTFDLVVPHD